MLKLQALGPLPIFTPPTARFIMRVILTSPDVPGTSDVKKYSVSVKQMGLYYHQITGKDNVQRTDRLMRNVQHCGIYHAAVTTIIPETSPKAKLLKKKVQSPIKNTHRGNEGLQGR